MIAARCPFLPFYPYAECAPESRRHFWASRNAIRSPDGVFWHQEMQSGVPTAFFGVRKCNPGSRRHFLASGNAIRGPDGVFWRQEMQSGVPTAFFGVRKCNPESRQPFPAYLIDKKCQRVTASAEEHHSVLMLSTGLRRATLNVCQRTERTATDREMRTAATSTHHGKSMR